MTYESNISDQHIAAGVIFALSVVISTLISRRVAKIDDDSITVTELWIYPIKSCKGIKVDTAKVTKRGLEHDRLLMIVDSDGKFVSQRSFPSLALVQTTILDNDSLLISANGRDELRISLSSNVNGPIVEVTVWGDKCEAFEILEGSYWFQEYLDKSGLRLVRMCDSCTRFTDPDYSPDGETGFSDGFPFLLISQGSLDDVNKHMPQPITMERFRPNIVVGGCNPYAEDSWKSITFSSSGDETVDMNVVKPCARCTIPNIDPSTGLRDEIYVPMKIMKSFRNGAAIGLQKEKWKKEIFLGQNLDHSGREDGAISVGDKVKVIRK